MGGNLLSNYGEAIAMILFGIAVLVSGTGGDLVSGIKGNGVWAIALMAGLGQSFVYVFYYAALGRQPVWLVKVFLLLMPVFTTVIETVTELVTTGATSMTWSRFGGMVLVLAGAVVLLLKKKTPKPAEQKE